MIAHSPSPTRVTVLAVSGSTMMTLASVIDPLRAANRLSDVPMFEWKLVSPDGKPIVLTGGIELPSSGALNGSDKGDILIVVASFDHQKNVSGAHIRALRDASRGFDIVCGVEAGTWLLGRAGLAANKRVTTHWEDLESLQQALPDCEVSNERFVIDGRLWTCGGASPAFDMMLYMIDQKGSAQLALEVASVFVYDQLHTASDKQPTTSLGVLEQNEPRLAVAIRIMEKNVELPISTAAIARRTGVSTKTLESLFRKFLHLTPGAYFLKLRLQMARKLVTDTSLGMQEIAVRTGFSSQSAFSRSFKTAYGTAPSRLRQGFGKVAENRPPAMLSSSRSTAPASRSSITSR